MPLRAQHFPERAGDAGVTVGTSLTTIFEASADTRMFLTLSVENAGTAAFNAFQLQIQAHPQADWWTVLAADWSTLNDRLLAISATPATLASGNQAHMQVNLLGAWSVRARASVAAGSATAKARGSIV